MARRIYFAFHYQDVIDFRANVVRNHWVTKEDRDAAGFFDASLWETAKRLGDVSIKRLINSGLQGTSVTCILIGSQTYKRRWVRYEILKSLKKGNDIIAVHINAIPGKNGLTKLLGPNPLSYVGVTFSASGLTARLYERIDGKWEEYCELDGAASYGVDAVAVKHRGQGYNLGKLCPTYDWVADDGFENFARWVR